MHDSVGRAFQRLVFFPQGLSCNCINCVSNCEDQVISINTSIEQIGKKTASLVMMMRRKRQSLVFQSSFITTNMMTLMIF